MKSHNSAAANDWDEKVKRNGRKRFLAMSLGTLH
jgi:hypothetical protein